MNQVAELMPFFDLKAQAQVVQWQLEVVMVHALGHDGAFSATHVSTSLESGGRT